MNIMFNFEKKIFGKIGISIVKLYYEKSYKINGK